MAKDAPKLPVLKDEYDERSKYDWTAIRHDFIYGVEDSSGTVIYPKPKELENIHNVPAQYVSNRATKEKWLKYREAQQNEEAIARQKEHQKRLANKAVKFDEEIIRYSETVQRILNARVNQIEMANAVDAERLNNLIMDVADGKRRIDNTLRNELKPLVSSYELESLMKSVALNLEVAHKAMGIDEGQQNVINTTVQIANVTPSQALQEADELRQKALEQFFNNTRAVIPSLGIGGPEDIEGELVDDSEPQRAISAEAGGQVSDPHSASGTTDSAESE